MITLRIIFYGLMAFVPSNNGEGMMVLAVDPNRAAMEAEANHMLEHRVLAFLVREKKHGVKLVPLPGWHPGTQLFVAPYQTYANPLELDQRLQTNDSDPLPSLPYTAAETRDFSWVPLLTELAPESAGIRVECLVNPVECPVTAVFRLWQGEARSCHLAHPRDSGVIAYSFRAEGVPPSEDDPRQAVADAVVVDLLVEEPALYLSHLTTNETERLDLGKPDHRNVITLLFANVGEESAVKEASHLDEEHSLNTNLHFRSFYQLAHTSPESIVQAIPYPVAEPASLRFLMDCEAEIKALESHLRTLYGFPDDDQNVDYVPHLVQLCGGTVLPGAPLPSLRFEYPIGSTTAAKTTAPSPVLPPRPQPVRRAAGEVNLSRPEPP